MEQKFIENLCVCVCANSLNGRCNHFHFVHFGQKTFCMILNFRPSPPTTATNSHSLCYALFANLIENNQRKRENWIKKSRRSTRTTTKINKKKKTWQNIKRDKHTELHWIRSACLNLWCWKSGKTKTIN